MYVRVVTVQVQPGKMDEVWRRLREAIPVVRAIRGFREARFLTDVHTDTVLGLAGANVRKFTVTTLTENYTFWSASLLLKQV
jgi:hypothetical protein